MRIVKIFNLADAERDEAKRLYQANLDASDAASNALSALHEFKRTLAEKYGMRFDMWGQMEGGISFTEDFAKAIGMEH